MTENPRDRFWREWFAEMDRQAREATSLFDSIMRECKDIVGDTPLDPPALRTSGHREYRDRLIVPGSGELS